MRSERTSPLAIRRPAACAASKRQAVAAAKCDPKTSAVVVPFAASARTNDAAMSRGVAVHRPCAILPEARTPPANRAATARDSRSRAPAENARAYRSNPGSRNPPRRSRTAASGWAARTLAKSPQAAMRAVADQQAAIVRRRAARPSRKALPRSVKDGGPQDLAGASPLRGSLRTAHAPRPRVDRAGAAHGEEDPLGRRRARQSSPALPRRKPRSRRASLRAPRSPASAAARRPPCCRRPRPARGACSSKSTLNSSGISDHEGSL